MFRFCKKYIILKVIGIYGNKKFLFVIIIFRLLIWVSGVQIPSGPYVVSKIPHILDMILSHGIVGANDLREFF
jgi:hypothetical protein